MAAFAQLAKLSDGPQSPSNLYQTPAFPKGNGADYINAAMRITWSGTARALLDELHEIEAVFGRERQQRWGQRTLDLDLLAVGDQVHPDTATWASWRDLPLADQLGRTPDQLILPHPRLQDRAFVLVPLADIAPDWRHPVLDQTVAEMCDRLPAELRAEVRALDRGLHANHP